jgi:hypothetical protein
MGCDLEMQRYREAYIEDREDVEFGVGARRGVKLQWERACGRPTRRYLDLRLRFVLEMELAESPLTNALEVA